MELVDYANGLGYKAIERIYHKKIGHENDDFRKVWSDSVILEIINGLVCGATIDLFICHGVDTLLLLM